MSSLIASHWKPEKTTLALMLDYDGTLAPIIDEPGKAYPLKGIELLLKQLSQSHRIHLAIVSGRSVEQLIHFLKPLLCCNVVFCGYHGGEIYVPQTQTFLSPIQDTGWSQLIQAFTSQLVSRLQTQGLQHPSLVIEEKKVAVALHYKLADSTTQHQVIQLFNTLFSENPVYAEQFKIQPGKFWVELLPKAFNKGDCVDTLLTHWKQSAPLTPCFLGDDLTDEAAFIAVNRYNGLSVAVGKSAEEKTDAVYRLPSVEAVYDELKQLCHQLFPKSGTLHYEKIVLPLK
jgi:trehalose 6-phosphate phosphatase